MVWGRRAPTAHLDEGRVKCLRPLCAYQQCFGECSFSDGELSARCRMPRSYSEQILTRTSMDVCGFPPSSIAVFEVSKWARKWGGCAPRGLQSFWASCLNEMGKQKPVPAGTGAFETSLVEFNPDPSLAVKSGRPLARLHGALVSLHPY